MDTAKTSSASDPIDTVYREVAIDGSLSAYRGWSSLSEPWQTDGAFRRRAAPLLLRRKGLFIALGLFALYGVLEVLGFTAFALR
jgi:hypothetical protein